MYGYIIKTILSKKNVFGENVFYYTKGLEIVLKPEEIKKSECYKTKKIAELYCRKLKKEKPENKYVPYRIKCID